MVMTPTILSDVPPDAIISREEAFAPVAILERWSAESELIQGVNSSRYGLQAGVFSESHSFLQRMADQLDVGGVILNDIPTYRADHLPYGGVKDSGTGREGVRWAMEEFCQRKTVVSRRSDR